MYLNKLLTISLLAAASCTHQPTTQQQDQPLPNTPEAVVRSWQDMIDQNQFDQAKRLSTPTTIAVIESIERIIAQEDDPQTFNTIFTTLQCHENGDSAKCYFTIQEDGETFNDSLQLLRIDGQWLIDIPEDTDEIDPDFDPSAIDSILFEI